MALFGLFFGYNLGILFIAFINKYKRTLILTLILTILSAATFFTLLYVFGLNRNIWLIKVLITLYKLSERSHFRICIEFYSHSF